MTDQQKFLKRALELSEENPDLSIKIRVDSTTLLDEYAWMEQRIVSVEIEDWYRDEDNIFVDDQIEDYFEVKFGENCEEALKEVKEKRKIEKVISICLDSF